MKKIFDLLGKGSGFVDKHPLIVLPIVVVVIIICVVVIMPMTAGPLIPDEGFTATQREIKSLDVFIESLGDVETPNLSVNDLLNDEEFMQAFSEEYGTLPENEVVEILKSEYGFFITDDYNSSSELTEETTPAVTPEVTPVPQAPFGFEGTITSIDDLLNSEEFMKLAREKTGMSDEDIKLMLETEYESFFEAQSGTQTP